MGQAVTLTCPSCVQKGIHTPERDLFFKAGRGDEGWLHQAISSTGFVYFVF